MELGGHYLLYYNLAESLVVKSDTPRGYYTNYEDAYRLRFYLQIVVRLESLKTYSIVKNVKAF